MDQKPAQPARLSSVALTDLSRQAGQLIDRVLTGERFVIRRHGRPVATLQPLSGEVRQPLSGSAHDVYGNAFGDAEAELAKLSEAQRALLSDGVVLGRLVPARVWHANPGPWDQILEDLVIRGLARRTSRGTILSGRGMVLREELFAQAGRGECDWNR